MLFSLTTPLATTRSPPPPSARSSFQTSTRFLCFFSPFFNSVIKTAEGGATNSAVRITGSAYPRIQLRNCSVSSPSLLPAFRRSNAYCRGAVGPHAEHLFAFTPLDNGVSSEVPRPVGQLQIHLEKRGGPYPRRSDDRGRPRYVAAPLCLGWTLNRPKEGQLRNKRARCCCWEAVQSSAVHQLGGRFKRTERRFSGFFRIVNIGGRRPRRESI